MDNYDNHIFVSYRRSDLHWVKWTRDNFAMPLCSLLRPSLGDVKLFIDENIETGVSWPPQLARELARSRILVPVLSRGYFQSEWCRLELNLMLERERQCGYRTKKRPSPLVLPVIIDDGECFHAEIQAIQGQKIHKFANPFMRPNSPKQERLADVLRARLCKDIEKALSMVPAFDVKWETIAHAKFKKLYQLATTTQTTLPRLKLVKNP